LGILHRPPQPLLPNFPSPPKPSFYCLLSYAQSPPFMVRILKTRSNLNPMLMCTFAHAADVTGTLIEICDVPVHIYLCSFPIACLFAQITSLIAVHVLGIGGFGGLRFHTSANICSSYSSFNFRLVGRYGARGRCPH
jgi:hypothetical protein